MKNFPLLPKLFFSLALFIIIPVIIVSIITNYTILHYAENEISKSGIGKLKVAKSLTEILTDNVSRETLRISLNNDLNNLSRITTYKPVLKDINQLSLISRALGIISEMVKTNSLYHSVYLYLDDADFILTSSFTEPENVITKQTYMDTGWIKHYQAFKKNKTRLSWLKTRMPKYNNTIVPGNSRIQENEPLDHYVITYIYPLTPYTTKLHGAIVVNLLEDSISKLINNNNADEGYIFIMTEQGDVLSHVDKTLVGKNIKNHQFFKDIIKHKSTEGYLVTKINQKRSLVTYLKTDFNGWIYVGVFPLNNLMEQATTLRMKTIAISVILAVLGVILSFVISRNIYNPVKTLIQTIKKRKGIEMGANQNEIVLLSNAFETLINEEDHLAHTLEKNRRNIRDNYLLSLIRGNITTNNLELIVSDFSNPYFICVLAAIDDYEQFAAAFSEEQQHYLKTLIIKVTEEIFAPPSTCVGLIFGSGQLVFILNVKANHDLLLNEIRASFLEIQTEIAKVFDNSISVGIGQCHEGKTGVKLSFDEAQETLKLKLIQGHGKVNIWQAEYFDNMQYYYPFPIEKYLLNYLELGLKDEALKVIHVLIEDIQLNQKLSYDNIIQIFNQLLGNTVKFLVESHIKISEIFGDDYHIYQELANKETLGDIKIWLIQIYTRIFEFKEKPKLNSKNHIRNILEYIHLNYRNDIDINTLADYVGISYSHLRKIFHDEIGENIVSYINNLRIEEAKRLLTQTHLTISEIAISLGYNNNQSFNRFFKKFEGITPGEFRNRKIFESNQDNKEISK